MRSDRTLIPWQDDELSVDQAARSPLTTAVRTSRSPPGLVRTSARGVDDAVGAGPGESRREGIGARGRGSSTRGRIRPEW